MPTDVFRFFRPTGDRAKDRPETRRAQLRRAQQAYRQRKDRYTKSLEAEVARLQATETKLLHETQNLRASMEALTNLLLMYGIDIPVHLEETKEVGKHDAHPALHQRGNLDCSVGAAQREVSHLHAGTRPTSRFEPKNGTSAIARDYYLGDSDASWPAGTRCDDGLTLWPVGLIDSPQSNISSGNDQLPTSPASPRLADLDATAVGMEFVLALESPCLGHLRGDPDNPDQPGGHALTVSAHLLFQCPSSAPPDADILKDACGRTPRSILDKLLSLSTDLALEGEVTPVQAWARLRHHPLFGGLEVDRLRYLTDKLIKAIKCHGYGAVLTNNVFENLLHEALVEGRPF
ncbi:hypothetical protein VTK73DRAFT_8066 [Phialemonium thermophilum]|uniref:BZIP domain-containing protein n=1 Tax=Phialemonium thermophilum TaxID=223376 RepID=A0ABR3XQU8_9PEZI